MTYHFSLYKKATGQFVGGGDSPTKEMAEKAAMFQPELAVYLGILTDAQYIHEGKVVNMPAKPSDNHVFSFARHAWVYKGLEVIQDEQIVLLNIAYENACYHLTEGYPPSEVATWANQQTEILAWEKDNTSPTPYMDTMASARGVDRLELLQRTLRNVRSSLDKTAGLTGKRQRLRDQILAAETIADVQSVLWSTD